MSKHVNFQDYLKETDEKWTSKYLKKGKIPLVLALEDAKKKGVSHEIIDRAEEQGMLDGSLGMTYEGAQRIYDRIRNIVGANVNGNGEYLKILDSLDPITDHDIIATTYFCLDPNVRDAVQDKLENLYRVVLNVGAKKRRGYSLPVKQKRESETEDYVMSSRLEDLIRSIPRKEFSGDEEYQRRLRVILDKKAEREIFPTFKKDTGAAFDLIDQKIAEEKNENLRDTYSRVKEIYKAYVEFETKDLNHDFEDPETKEKGILPSLHQRIALYHLLREGKFGIFDGCGTGKTAIAVLAQPLLEEEYERKGEEFKRTVVVCPNTAKKAWKKGLIGDDNERYLAERQDIAVINGGRKDEAFMDELKDKKWIILNYEQLTTKVNGTGKLFAEALVDMGVNYVISDESHHIKGHRKKTSKGRPTLSAAARYLGHSAEHLALLTGSPMPDKLEDYAVLCNLLNPDLCPKVEDFESLYEKNPRVLYTLFNERTIRRTSEDINADLEWDETDEQVELDPIQRQLYQHIVEFRPKNWLMQARKALLDPRLVDPEILKRAGVLGQITHRTSAKYRKLENLLTDEDGPVASGEKFVIFSSMFREGVTQGEHEKLRKRYGELGLNGEYQRLQLNKSLDVILEEAIEKKFNRKLYK